MMKRILLCASVRTAIAVVLLMVTGCDAYSAQKRLLITPQAVSESGKATGTPTANATATAEKVNNHAQAANTPHATQRACTVFTGIDAGGLNLRSCDSVNCPVIDVLREGQTVTVFQDGQDWLLVQTDSAAIGWVNKDFCK